ncbi:L-sorbose 1-dehydrogenase [Manduca sexta]|uniref:L-sorbose 1-dehydrogenase n=2 Tax=Manduca sexta TaxID=7130 RepID=UPI00118244B9|nr:L-sorbose 1-dehydrogenase [Manduca sexta]
MSTSITESTISSVQGVQGMLTAITALGLTGHRFPAGVDVEDGAVFDFLTIGSGAGGSVVASRLSEDPNASVLLLEAGQVAPLESTYVGLFPVLVNSAYDWNATSTNDNYANQCLQNNVVETTMGKMLGGSSGLDHVIAVRANKFDMERWAKATGDDSFNHENMKKYYINSETLNDKDILAEYASHHGTKGPLQLIRETSDKNKDILESFKELGHDIILDINADLSLGYTEPLLLKTEEWRQSAAEAYLGAAKNRPNLFVQMGALVTKIYINSSNVATGVEILTSDGVTKSIYARKEVILCGGAIKSPQLLMLSGVGPKSHLEEFGIEVKADLPVGENLMDHVSAIVGITLKESDEKVLPNTMQFPVPMTTGYVSLDGTEDPTYQSINLYFPHDNAGLLQLCAFAFKYNNTVCEALYKANTGRDLLFSVINLMHPESSGSVRLNSVHPAANPTINLGHLSNPNDLDNLAKSLQDFVTLLDTSYFKNIGAKLVDIDLTCNSLDRTSFEFFKCYARWMSATMWHYSSTCAIGKVLDSDMTVKGIQNLRVVDASAMPYTVTGNIISNIYAMAEKAVENIKAKWCLS